MTRENLLTKTLKHPDRAVRKVQRILEHHLNDASREISQLFKDSPIINQKEIRIVGLRRTGNHAIGEWIKAQETGTVWFVNNLVPGENPYRYKYENLQDYYPQYQEAIARYRKDAKGDFTLKNCLLYSYEDHGLEDIFCQKFEKKHDLYLGKSAKRYDVLILRDPFNLLASRLKNNYLDVKVAHKTVVDLWLGYAKEYLGETQYSRQSKVCINYNQWFQDIDYRRAIANQLNLNFTDAGINQVAGCGGGSSFDKDKFQGKATKMNVLKRWESFAENQQYRQLLNNKEILSYSEEIFGHIPGTELLFQ